MNLFLIGYRGTGKTTVAELLGERIRWPWIDADVEIENRAGQTIADIFVAGGESLFRDIESDVVADLAGRTQMIVALGGGAVLREKNRQVIRAGGKIIWLTANAQAIYERINGDASTRQRRPNLTASGGLREIEELLVVREPIYRSCADLVVSTDGSPPVAVADKIVNWFHSLELGDTVP